ncbi:trifunctional serine/threonine-protein kinase/ATP-binding protein/sensor histidine kinase [Cystobacter ferrugineus]|uniref:histidine kinase n=1 Tax=Cystobacter ferrugineus TaxID=83449 RepID=A0A1L9BIW9_9BACT|nr:trifunctional serine/threonine-protein kinase/ATP-binding protein/sensor histidine kinase [Cystobacter ferrugineus]OJH42210.1 histidine kinase [Cystobacter ferrugineus]
MLKIPGYTLLGVLKTTGTSLLFRGWRETDGLRLILKTPLVSAPGPRECENYLREFGMLQRLRDVRGVIRAHACEQLQGRPVLLLEDVDGTPLSESTGEPLPVTQALDLAIAVASTLAELHRRGIVHKDLKPSNIILTPSGETRLIDFGIASLQPVEHVDVAPSTLIEGTLAYMSPEQTGRMNRSVDYRTDLYSLGITLYELLAGQRPFHGRDALEWFHAHMAQAPQPLTARVENLPPALSAIVMKLLAKVAEERYQSAEGLKADLERCREGLGRGVLEDFVPGRHDYPSRFQLPQRLYGRDSHAKTLLQAFERVAESGQPELVLVSGYSGIGKSSVVNELHKPVVRRRSFLLRGKFDQFQRDIPYATVAKSIQGLVRQLLGSTDEELARWRQRLGDAWADEGQVLVDLVPQLELVAGGQPPVPELPPSQAQQRLHRVLRRFLGVFSTPGHPLVFFMDDLQWADLASFQMLQHLMTHPETPPLLLIAAYRDNEIHSSHPLTQTLEQLRQASARMAHVQLEPLSLEDVRQLVTDALPGAGAELVGPLAALTREKTGGNPFFLLRFLQTLHQDGLLVRTPEGSWRWDEQESRAKGYSDNVVDFLVARLRQFPPRTQHLLRLAACVGNIFSPHTLLLISGMEEPGEVEQGLELALQEGVLATNGPEQYRFLHDRIRQAAHTLIPEDQRKAVHLRVGRLLLASLSPEEVHQNLFEVVGQLNTGADLLTEPEERHRVARLNAEAGARAKASNAHRSAITYLAMAFQLLPGEPWEVDHALAFKLRLDHASCEFMSGNAAQARRMVEELRGRTRTPAEMAALYRLKGDLHVAAGENQVAVDSLLEGLAMLGMPLPPHPSWEEVVAAHEEVGSLLGERAISSLVELPRLNDPVKEAVMGLLVALNSPALNTDRHLYLLHLCKLVCLSIRHGLAPASVHGFSTYGMVLGLAFKRYPESLAFGQLARALAERYDAAALRGRALFGMGMLSHWLQPLSASLDYLRESFQLALQASDFQTAGFCCTHIVSQRLSLGHELQEVYQESVARLDFARMSGFVDVRDVVHVYQRLIQQLRGRTASFQSLNGDDFSEEAFEARLTPERTSIIQCMYWVLKTQSRFLGGAYDEAREAADRAARLSWSLLGRVQLQQFHFFHALTLAACFGKMAPEERGPALEVIRGHQARLSEWASHCPENFRALERMVSAELARLLDHEAEALRAYEEAIRSAREQGRIHDLALASELAARFWFERGVPTIAEAYARKARGAWLRWGALGKVQQLDAQWAHPSSLPSEEATSTDTSSTHVDALTVVKAQQAISGEMVLDRLGDTLLRVAIENAGAQRGALLLLQGDKLTVVAFADSAPEGTAGSREERLPWTLISFVRRTREHVLIGDASKLHSFSADAWLQRGGARSVLCLPLVRQEAFRGVLYLENSLASDAFTPARISLLGHLAAQATISIENARLYTELQSAEAALRRANDELEKRVEERTRELRHAQAQLVDTARAVGMAEVATNVLHNVGNVLTSAIINVQVLTQTVRASRMLRVKQVSAMFEQHAGCLLDFLTRDPRGTHLPDYLSSLADELLREHETLQEGLEAMNKHIEHVRAIVQVQQTYARSTLLTEECDLSRLVEDAVSIQLPALKSHGVNILQELSTLPTVRVDKHKVLQILINLISNARNAMIPVPSHQRRLHVRLDAVDNMARIQVVDNGTGIAPELRERLFTQGFTTREGGHGLGLHSSSLAARMLGGQLTLESDGPGRGATATLTLPLA